MNAQYNIIGSEGCQKNVILNLANQPIRIASFGDLSNPPFCKSISYFCSSVVPSWATWNYCTPYLLHAPIMHLSMVCPT